MAGRARMPGCHARAACGSVGYRCRRRRLMRRRFSAGRRSIEIETTWNCWRMNSVCVARGKADLRLSAAALHFSSLRHVGMLCWLPRAQDFLPLPGRLVGYWGVVRAKVGIVSWAGGRICRWWAPSSSWWSWVARFCIRQFQGPQR